MRPAWLPLVALLLSAGCTAPPPGIVTVPLDDEAERAAASAPCERQDCSWEWWNLTVEGEGRRRLGVPFPAAMNLENRPVHADLAAWARNVTYEGVPASLGMHAHPAVLLDGEGPASVRTHRLDVAPPGRFAETFLWARWGDEANQTRPDALPVQLSGRVDALRLTYEAHGERCRRSAEFTLEGPLTADGTVWLSGRDAAVCR